MQTLADLQNKLRDNPDDREVLDEAIERWGKGDQSRQLIQILRNGVRRSPESASLFFALGQAYEAGGKANLAVPQYLRGIKLESSAEVWLKLAFCYQRLEQWDKLYDAIASGLDVGWENCYLDLLGDLLETEDHFSPLEILINQALAKSENLQREERIWLERFSICCASQMKLKPLG